MKHVHAGFWTVCPHTYIRLSWDQSMLELADWSKFWTVHVCIRQQEQPVKQQQQGWVEAFAKESYPNKLLRTWSYISESFLVTSNAAICWTEKIWIHKSPKLDLKLVTSLWIQNTKYLNSQMFKSIAVTYNNNPEINYLWVNFSFMCLCREIWFWC